MILVVRKLYLQVKQRLYEHFLYFVFQIITLSGSIWPCFHRNRRVLSAGQLDWIVGRLDWTAGRLDWFAGRMNWIAGQMNWTAGRLDWTAGQVDWIAGQSDQILLGLQGSNIRILDVLELYCEILLSKEGLPQPWKGTLPQHRASSPFQGLEA